MPIYYVSMVNTVSTSIKVEADTWEAARDAAYDSDDMPGGITIGAFGPQPVDDGEWTADSVSDSNRKTVWRENR